MRSTAKVGSLSSAQIAHYDEFGYVTVQNVLGADGVARYLQRAKEIANGDVPEEASNQGL